MSPDHRQLLDPTLLEDLADRPIEEVRAQRADCVEFETGLSYLRRLVQGSLDIVERELARRSGDAAPGRGNGLLDELPDILGENPRPAGSGRLSQSLEPTYVDEELGARYEALTADGRLARADQLDEGELTALADGLRGLESLLSQRRQDFFERIDLLQAELTRRYQSGEASVDSLLRDA